MQSQGVVMVFFTAWMLVVNLGWASPHFTTLRDDLSVPEHCRDMKLSFYQLPPEKIYVGREGALDMGFTMEYPIKREDARTLWHYFKGLTEGKDDYSLYRKIQDNPDLKRDYDVIINNYLEQDFDFQAEGEILEALAIADLYREFPSNHFYITGGVTYHKPNNSQTIGEVDLFVGLKDTCEAILVGEVKLGRKKSLSKAKQQLGRFENFLIDHNAPGMGGEYKSNKSNKGFRASRQNQRIDPSEFSQAASF
jgi:hypothetical protein